MSTVAELEKLVLDLPESDRALLAAHLLRSLSPVLEDEDEGIAEALRRDAEYEGDNSVGISVEEFDKQVKSHRKR